MSTATFYDELTPLYHWIYVDWEEAIRRHALQLDGIVRQFWPSSARTILDASCGIGTQALGLAELGYQVTARDISAVAIARLEREAATRGLTIETGVADMRALHEFSSGSFDLVISCDNSVPHLLTDKELLSAFGEFARVIRPGGGCVVSVRDYAGAERVDHIRPYGIRQTDDGKLLMFQAWEWRGDVYDCSFYFVFDRGGAGCEVRVSRVAYYAVSIDRLMELMTAAGFQAVRRLEDRFFQPVLIGFKPAA